MGTAEENLAIKLVLYFSQNLNRPLTTTLSLQTSPARHAVANMCCTISKQCSFHALNEVSIRTQVCKALNKSHAPLGLPTQNPQHTRALHIDINILGHARVKVAGGHLSLPYYL
jgi:cytosine/adenosine deaminase-related metal-dependent hydrolase